MPERQVERRIKSVNYIDHNGRSVGGQSTDTDSSIQIRWFGDGLYGSRSGAFVEDVLMAAYDRLEFFQRTVMRCDENTEALLHIQKAMDALLKRCDRREAEGTLEKPNA